MADMENQEDQKISECLQEAFGYSDEQLLKQLDHVNENFKDVSFAGAEERLMKRFMERKAEMERKAVEAGPETTKSGAQVGGIPEITAEAEDCASGEESKTEPLELEKRQGEKQNKKKIVRFGKKKALATAALVAVIAGMLGGTAIGKKSYFLKVRRNEATISLDNDKNMPSNSKLEQAYEALESELGLPVLKLGYIPKELQFINYDIYEDGGQIEFSYCGKSVYLIQRKKEMSVSAEIKSDRNEEGIIFNKWINKDIEYYINDLEDNNQECECFITINNSYYYLFGYIEKEEFEKILEYLNFF